MKMVLASIWNELINLSGRAIGFIVQLGISSGFLYFPFVSEALSCIPFSVGWKLRRAVYARILPAIGTDAVLHFGVTLEDERTVIGHDVWISRNCYVDYAIIGDHVLIGPQVVLLAGKNQHKSDRLDVPIKQQGNFSKPPVRVGDGVWIGANATIMADVGQDAIVGAGAVVTKPVPPLAVVAGNPARLLRYRTESDHKKSDLFSSHENFTENPRPVIV